MAYHSPELAGMSEARETPAVQNMASSWDQGPQELSVEESVKPPTATHRNKERCLLCKEGPRQRVYSLARDLYSGLPDSVITQQECLAVTFRKIKFGLQRDSSMKPSLTTPELSSRGRWGAPATAG